jgi:Lrp/AsnC family leucine-responsive transcriptional regulator
MIDDIDRQILTILQENARTPSAEVARRIGMAASAIHERIRKLEERGIIEGYTAKLNAKALERGLVAFVFVRAEEPLCSLETGERLAAIPEVQEVHHVAGEDCYLVKVRVADTEALQELLRTRFGSVESVKSTRTTIVLGTVKETSAFPVPAGAEAMPEEAVHG